MAPLAGCFTRFASKLGRVQHQQTNTTAVEHSAADEHLSPEDIQHAQYLATTNLKLIEDDGVKRDQATFLSKHFPELAQYDEILFNGMENYFLVDLSTVRVSKVKQMPLPVRIGYCPVYLMQAAETTTYFFTSQMRPDLSMSISDSGSSSMTPAEFLADADDLCGLVQAFFQRSIDLRLHAWHYIDVLYPSKKALKKEADLLVRNWIFPTRVCQMAFDLKVWDDEVKLPGTTVVRFDPEKRMEVMEWFLKVRKRLEGMNEKTGRHGEDDETQRRDSTMDELSESLSVDVRRMHN